MKRTAFKATVILIIAIAWGACSRENEAAREGERQRLELEEQARRETEAAQKAITGVNQRLFSKRPPQDTTEAEENKPATDVMEKPSPAEASDAAP